MVDATHISFSASDRSYYSLIKKEIHKRITDFGIEESRAAEVDLIVSEMTSNLYKYADHGEILLGKFTEGTLQYIEIICLDNGPGIANPNRMMQDGMSTSNTMGAGLGSIKRLSDTFDIFSMVGWGTILLSRIYIDKKPAQKAEYIIRPLIVSKPGEKVSGDGLVIRTSEDGFRLLLADGLGHGPEANKAVNEAAKSFIVVPDKSPTQILRFVHNGIKKTRGMVANIVCYSISEKKWTSAGIGNIAAKWIGPVSVKNHMSYNGIVGHNIPNTMNDQSYQSADYNMVVLCSDGIKTRWETSRYPQILKHDPSILCAVLYKEHARRTDDMSVVVIKTR